MGICDPLYIKYLEGFKERCPTLLVSEQEPEICSLSRSGNTEQLDSASISSTTRREITSTSSLTVQSTVVCPTSSTTERPAESSTLPPTPSVSSATSASTLASSQRESPQNRARPPQSVKRGLREQMQ